MFHRNYTSMIVSFIYILISYAVIQVFVPPEDMNPLYVVITPLGVAVIIFLFNYVIKYDYFDKYKNDRDEEY